MLNIKIYVKDEVTGKDIILTSYSRKYHTTLEEAYDIGYNIIKNTNRDTYVSRIDFGRATYHYSSDDVKAYLEWLDWKKKAA